MRCRALTGFAPTCRRRRLQPLRQHAAHYLYWPSTCHPPAPILSPIPNPKPCTVCLSELGPSLGLALADSNIAVLASGPAINHFQQIGQGFWEPLLIAIGVAESYRVAIGWATPTNTGFNSLKDDYEPGDLG